MCDNNIRLKAIRKTLNRLFGFPEGNPARRLGILSLMINGINGIIGSGHVSLSKIAKHECKNTDAESKVKQKSRFLQNGHVTFEAFYLPYIAAFLAGLSNGPELVFSMDGSTIGRGCMCLMISVKYKKRAIPVVWLVVEGKKGHLPEALHVELLRRLAEFVPRDCRCVLLGDGEFDGCDLQNQLSQLKWEYVLRTGPNIMISTDFPEKFKLRQLDPGKEEYLLIEDVKFSAKRFGPVNVLVWHGRKYKDPVYLVTNIDHAPLACRYYKWRFLIETLFSDQKSRGFHIQKSHVSCPERLQRLLIATCIAYIWIVLMGDQCLDSENRAKVHRKDSCDISMFTLGLRYITFLINRRIPLRFEAYPSMKKSVR
jgi:hypothetical protein